MSNVLENNFWNNQLRRKYFLVKMFSLITLYLKGQCHKICGHNWFAQNTLASSLMNRFQLFCEISSFHKDIFRLS